MPQTANTTGDSPDGTPPAQEPITQTPPVQPPAPAQLPPAPAVPTMPPTAQQASQSDPNVDMARQFNHLRGELNARIGEWESWQGQAQQVNRQLAADLATAQARVTELEASNQQQAMQLQEAEGLQTVAQQNQALQQQNERLQMLMRFPAILQQQYVQGVPGEGDTPPTQVVVNPYLDLLLNSTLQGENFQAAAQQIAQSLAAQAEPALPRGSPQTPAQVVGQLPNIVQPQTGQPPQNFAQATMQQAAQFPQLSGTQQFPTVVATPPIQPAMNTAQRIAALERARDEATDAGRYNEARALDDQARALARGENPQQ